MSFMKGNLLTKYGLLIRGKVIEKPKWYDAVKMVPPEPVKERNKRAPKIVYDEDKFVESFYARHPEAKLLYSFSLKSFDPPIARRFARRQLELLPEMRNAVLNELKEEYKKNKGRGGKANLEEFKWTKWHEKKARTMARDHVEKEIQLEEQKAEDAEMMERQKAIMDGRPLPQRKKSIMEEVEEEQTEALKRGLEILGAQLEEKEKGRN